MEGQLRMRKLCVQLESGNKKNEKHKYETIFEEIKKWYLEQYDHYETLIKNDMISALGQEVIDQITSWDELKMTGYTDNFSAKVNLFNMADIMCKLMLSVYSYGPDATIPVDFKKASKGSWLECKLNVNHINELLQFQLKAHNEGSRINLAALTEDRKVRNDLTHHGEVSICSSAIRCYNVLREMIIFMEPESCSELPRFSYPNEIECNMQQVMGRLQNLHFKSENTLLVVGPLHDASAEGKSFLANLPWTVVLDLDGYSDFGGLRSAVAHNNINDQKLQPITASNFTPRKDYTTWFTCGDFCSYSYLNGPRNEISFNTLCSFSDDFFKVSSDLRKCLESIISKLSGQMRPLNIFYLYYHDLTDPAQILIELCEQYYHYSNIAYSITAAYYETPTAWEKSRERLARSYDLNAGEISPLETICCDIDSLVAGLLEYRNSFPVQTIKDNPHMLPSEDGHSGISNNLASDLAEIFDVLYYNIGEESIDTSTTELSNFYHGGEAAWSVFSNEQTFLLIRKAEYEKRLAEIRNTLNRIPDSDSASKKVFNLEHTPGIGGSTLLRQIGWDLHKEFPVLFVRKYSNKIKNLIRQLYDDRKKGILILADEAVTDIDSLKADVCSLDRACALIISGRKDCMAIGKKENRIPFQVITDDSEKQLRKRFKEFSGLSAEQLEVKDKQYEEFIGVNRNEMRCPFMIGLYYQEADFNGVKSYVGQLLNSAKDKREVKIIAMLAFCDYYGQTGLPQLLVDQYLNIPRRSSYLANYPYAKSVFLLCERFEDRVDCYCSKHPLISREILEQSSQKLYGTSLKGCLTDLSRLLIDAVFSAYKVKASQAYQEVLERIFIDKSAIQDKFSKLILDVSTPMFRKEILKYLAEQFDTLANSKDPQEDNALYSMTAHFFGHLGRICSNRDYGVDNPQDAKTYCEKAVILMEKASTDHPDPLIYHMLGEARKSLLQKRWNDLQDKKPTAVDYDEYQQEIETIHKLFDKTALYGSESYAIISQIGMYVNYLKRVYTWKDITKPEHISKLTTQEVSYRGEIEELLERFTYIESDEHSREYYVELENEFRSKIMLGDYSSTIQYYENLISKLSTQPGQDIELQSARKGLINARLARHYSNVEKNPGTYVEIQPKELTSILILLEDILGQPVDPNNYRQRNQRTSSYARWFYLAKMKNSGRTLTAEMHYSERWIELETQCKGNDPRPYYYHYICSMLHMLEGNRIDLSTIERSRSICYKYAQGHYKTDRIRDLLVKGSGLEQLLDLRFVGRDMTKYLQSAKCIPMPLEGRFDHISANKGYMRITSPNEWNEADIKFTLGTSCRVNSVGENQLTHILGTFAGFSFEGLCSIDQYVKDYTAKEFAPQLTAQKTSEHIVTSPQKSSGIYSNSLIGMQGLFIAEKITQKNGLSGIIEVGKQRYNATLSSRYVSTQMIKEFNRKHNLCVQASVVAVHATQKRCVVIIAE